jgi:hypothetical protein
MVQTYTHNSDTPKYTTTILSHPTSLRHRTTIDKLELLGQAMRNAQHAARGGLKAATVCVYRETPIDSARGGLPTTTGRPRVGDSAGGSVPVL